VLNRLVQLRPDDVFANLFRGSSRLLKGVSNDAGVIDIERALTLDPLNAHVRYVVADAYTYGLPDPERAFSKRRWPSTGTRHTAHPRDPRQRLVRLRRPASRGEPRSRGTSNS
jgi:hypothetical protein